MKTDIYPKLKYLFFLLIVITVMATGCGSRKGENNAAGAVAAPSQILDTVLMYIPEIGAGGDYEALVRGQEEDAMSDKDPKDGDPKNEDLKVEEQEPILGDNGSMEIYAAREVISLPDDMIVGQVTVEDILQGNLILYDRFIADGFVFEWMISDYEDDDYFTEDGVLIISKEEDAGNTQVIHVQGRGGDWGPPADLANKFKYMDVNFDDIPDLLICTGHHGAQGLITYYCFVQTDAGFAEAPTFTEIANPSVDAENKLILSQWRNWALSHSWAEYKYQDNAYVLSRELCEEPEISGEGQDASEVWVWTVNGVEIGRSDQLSETEIEDLLYNKNSEWRLTDDRWRTIYNDGLMKDYSIYATP